MAEKRVTVWVQEFKDREALVLQWHDPATGKRRSESAGTADPKEAEKKRADKEYELNHGLHKDVSRMSWERFRELFETEYAAAHRPNTQRNFKNTFDLFEELCHPKRLALITARTLSAFATGMRERSLSGGKKGMQPSTIKVRFQFLRVALHWAVAQGLLPKCPGFPTVKVPDRKPRPVPVESFERLFDKAPDQETRAYLLCGWLAGLRLDEAFMLEREETEQAPYVDWARERVVLPAGFVKGVRDQWVPLDPVLREALEALPRHGRRVFHFTDPRDGHPITAWAVSRRVRMLARKAGVKLTMQTLRKGFGCRYAGKVPAQVLQKLMRHGDIKTTMAYYVNVDEAVEEAVLGPRGNRSRNKSTSGAKQSATDHDATSSEGKGSS